MANEQVDERDAVGRAKCFAGFPRIFDFQQFSSTWSVLRQRVKGRAIAAKLLIDVKLGEDVLGGRRHVKSTDTDRKVRSDFVNLVPTDRHLYS